LLKRTGEKETKKLEIRTSFKIWNWSNI